MKKLILISACLFSSVCVWSQTVITTRKLNPVQPDTATAQKNIVPEETTGTETGLTKKTTTTQTPARREEEKPNTNAVNTGSGKNPK